VTLLHDLLDAAARRTPGSCALRYQGRELTYAQLRESSLRCARGLQAQGIRRGDRVVVHLPNRPEIVEVFLACSRIGAVCVPSNALLKPRQLMHILVDCGARLLVTGGSVLPMLAAELDGCPTLEAVFYVDRTLEDQVATQRLKPQPFTNLGIHEELTAASPAIDIDVAALLYTSGSSGRPKGVIITHRNLVSGAQSVASYLDNRPTDRILAALPLSFDYGFSQVTTAFHVGACAVLTNYSLPAALLNEVYRERITGLAGVPTMWTHIAAASWPEEPPPDLRYVTNSGGALGERTVNLLASHLPRTRIFRMYGLTEAFRSTYLDPAELLNRPGSIGKAVPNQEVMVLRPDGTPCLPGEVGELVHRGSFVSLGYWNAPELTAQRFRPLPPRLAGQTLGELAVWSGDLVRMDEDGFLYFMDRADQQLKTSGVRVSPTEIEEIAAEVEGVIEAVAVGLPDERLGQRIVLAIVAAGRCDENLVVERVLGHCAKELPAFMQPAAVVLLPSVARTPNGKPDRAGLAAQLATLTPTEPPPRLRAVSG
jgi:acyl-CoA ligase (AMP-forming) (exosortase A-associated)